MRRHMDLRSDDRAATGTGEIDEFEALAILGLLDSTFGSFDDAGDRFDMRIKGTGEARER